LTQYSESAAKNAKCNKISISIEENGAIKKKGRGEDGRYEV
jgi:hypothetical protein